MTLTIVLSAGEHEFDVQVYSTLESASPDRGYVVVDPEIVGVSRYRLIGEDWHETDQETSDAMASLFCELYGLGRISDKALAAYRQRLVDKIVEAAMEEVA